MERQCCACSVWVYDYVVSIMTFCSFCKEIKKVLGIEALTEVDAKRIMELYLTRTPVEKAIEMMKEK